MPPIRELLIGAVLPGAIATLVLGAAWLLLGRRPQKRPLPRWSAPLAFALAYLPADYAIASWPRLWPAASTSRFVHVALLLGLVGVGTSMWRGARPAYRGGVHFLALAASMWMLLGPLARTRDVGTMLVWVAASAVAAFGFAFLLGRESERRGGWAPPAFGASIALAVSPTLLFGSVAAHAQIVGGVVAMLTAAAIVGALSPRFTMHHGGSLVIAGLLTGMLATGYHFATVQWTAAALILASPAVLWIDRVPLIARRAWWQRFLLEAALLAMPLAVAVLIADASKPDYPYY